MTASVIITTFQRPQYLGRAVASVLAQTVPVEVVVVDDNGLESAMQLETQKYLAGYLDKVTYIPLERNVGACLARNKGVEVATGDYIFFLDDDDEFLPTKVEKQMLFLAENTDYDGCLSAFKRVGNNGKEIYSNFNFPSVGNFTDFAVKGNFFTPMLAIRKSSFIRAGGFREIPRFQDRYFMLYCLRQQMKFATIKDQLHIMYEHTGDRVTNINCDKSISSLNIIRNFVDTNKCSFNSDDYRAFIQKDVRMRAIIYYVDKNHKLKAAWYYLKTWHFSKKINDFTMIIKSML